MLSLRLTLAVLSAATVAIVASVTLSLALTSSLDALRAMGTRHASALLTVAQDDTTQLFRTAEDITLQLVNVTATKAWANPSEDATVFATFETLVQAAFIRDYPAASAVSIFFADNTVMDCDAMIPALQANNEYLYRVMVASNFTRDYARGNQTVTAQQRIYSLATHTYVRDDTDPSVPPLVIRGSALWDTFNIATFNSYAPAMAPPIAIYTNGFAASLVPIGAPLYIRGVASRGQASVFGYATISVSLEAISGFLQRTKSTPNTAAFAVDRSGHLIGTSEAASHTQRRPLASVVPAGCASTADYADASSAGLDHFLLCRLHAAQYPHAALNAVAAGYAGLLQPGAGAALVERVGDLDGTAYYVAAAQVPLQFRGLSLYLLLLMPEADVIGDVITSRNVAIGVTCGLVVLAAAANVAVVWLLLAPLGGIAERMMRAANLEDDDADASVSVMAEVAELQEAYYAMNEELNRIRSYVPQSVLVARKVARGEDDDEEAEGSLFDTVTAATSVHGAGQSAVDSQSNTGRPRRGRRNDTDTSDTCSQRSTHTRRSEQVRTPVAGGTAFDAVATVLPALASRNASVVCANVRGLHASVGAIRSGPMASDALVETVAAAAALVETAVTQRHGVLTFHGDRFLATFNTARPCAGHAVKAATAAVAITVPTVGPAALRLAAGVATGPCAVGSMGSATMKTLSTVGPAVSNAAALERLTRFHDGVSVIATHRTAMDAATAVGVRYVDLVAIQGKTGSLKPSAVADLRPHAATASPHDKEMSGSTDAATAEWMYVLQGAAGAAYAAYNPVFEALEQGDVPAALAAYAVAEETLAARREAAGVDASEPAACDADSCPCPARLVDIMAVLRARSPEDPQQQQPRGSGSGGKKAPLPAQCVRSLM